MASEEAKGQRACVLSPLPATGLYRKALQGPTIKTCNSPSSASVGSAISDAKVGLIGRSQQRDVEKDLINTGFGMDPESQFLSQKQGRPAKRDLKAADIAPCPLKIPVLGTQRCREQLPAVFVRPHGEL